MTKKTVLVKGSVWSSIHAITITLNPKMFCMEPVMQRNALQGLLNSICENNEDIRISLIAELTKAQNIHGHGLVQVRIPQGNKQTVPFLCAKVFRPLKDIGYICVKQIEDYDGWLEYITKEISITRHNLEESPILLDYINAFGWDVKYTGLLKQDSEDDDINDLQASASTYDSD